MKNIILFALAMLGGSFITQVSGQDLSLTGSPASYSPQIVNIQSIGKLSGIAFTRDAVYRSDDDGAAWVEIGPVKRTSQAIAQVHFANASDGWLLLADTAAANIEIRRTTDGGASWTAEPIAIDPQVLSGASVDGARLTYISSTAEWNLTIPLETSSNFRGQIVLGSADRVTWNLRSRNVDFNSPEAVSNEVVAGGWTLRTDGNCYGQKTGCVQETHLFTDGREITPPQIRELARRDRDRAIKTGTPMFAAPGGTTRTSLNRGFDMCNAPTAAQMLTWWNASPLYDMNIYMSGRNRACSTQANLSASWVNQVTAMGWGLIPTVVGYQSPCTASITTVKLSYDLATAETQGRGEADIAVAAAINLGLTAGSILYYDMERYDETVSTPGCRTATTAFLKGWTDRTKELGFKSGVYGSPKNAQEDWVTLAPASKPDAIWMARWDNNTSVWAYLSFPTFPTTEWANHQRIKQWQAPHNETWGGVTFNIDGNNADGPVAGVTILKNRAADFDGDGKSDVSAFRPSEGIWYVLLSVDFTFKGVGFGNASDVIAPGDFDGDGKTDYCVFRPADGYWHILTKANQYNPRQFGAAGDIPVPADFNGDGKTDIAVFRPSNGVWYIANSDSQGSITIIQFGQAGDKPVPGDYDGDGRADLAVYRPSSGTWYILRSSDMSFYGVGFGLATDMPAQGDYDGDGRTDQAVYRDGMWYLLQSTAGFGVVQFGQTGDLPATGDFDGDGRSDVAVFRPSTGVWYTLRSTAGFWAVAFGQSGDRPVESAYLPQ